MDTSVNSVSSPFSFSVSTRPATVSPLALRARMDRAESPLVLDVRRRAKFLESARMVVGAMYCAPEDVAAFAVSQVPAREVVVYCAYGHNLSAEAAAQLNAASWQASTLAGGIGGGEDGVDSAIDIAQWCADPVLTFAKRPDWGVSGEQASCWITRERPKIDRVACPWLIRRFIDPRAVFVYAPNNEVLVQAQRLGAVAFDTPGAPVSHDGERCSFDALVKGFDLHDAALNLLATIVRGADTDRLDIAAQSSGLLAISLGLSKLHALDDHAMLAAAMPVYDALYAWCSDKVHQQDEAHAWKPA